MMVKWAYNGLLQANASKMLVNNGKMLVNDGEMLVNDGEMSVWLYTHCTIIDEHFTTSLKYTVIRSFNHHWEAAPTVKWSITFPIKKSNQSINQ